MRQFVRSDAIVRSDPRLSGANTSADAAKRGKACFLLFSIEQNFYFVQSRISLKASPPAGIGGTMVADKREQVKIEQIIVIVQSVRLMWSTGLVRLSCQLLDDDNVQRNQRV